MTRTYRIIPEGRLFKIKWEGGGQLSETLSGLYTSVKLAEHAISTYEANKPKKRKATRAVKDGTTETESGK